MTAIRCPTLVVALHDGWYGCGTGAGYANRAFIGAVARAIAPGVRLVVLPVRLTPDSREYDAGWHQESLALVGKATQVRPVDNGTGGLTRFGGIPAFRHLADTTAAALSQDILPTSEPIHLVLLDVPFLGVPPQLPPAVVQHVTVLPRSSAALHDPSNTERFAWERHGMRLTVQHGGRIVAISSHMRRHLQQAYGVPACTIIDLPDSLAIDELHRLQADAYPLPEPALAGFLLAMGRAQPYKGFNDLLDAIHHLTITGTAVPHLLLAAVTDDDELNDHQRHLARRIVDQQLDATLLVRFHPGIRGLLAHPALRAVIVPSRTEPFGRIPTEAHAAGAAPVVATTAGGLADQVADGKTGYTAEAANPVSLASAIGRALTASPATIRAMRAVGRRRVEDRLAYDQSVRQFLLEATPWAVAAS